MGVQTNQENQGIDDITIIINQSIYIVIFN